jgi:hypothetical protein
MRWPGFNVYCRWSPRLRQLAMLAMLAAVAFRGVVVSAVEPPLAQPPLAQPTSSRFAATPVAEWDAAFTCLNGWTGGDVVGTVDLERGRELWLFGDTWIGRIANDKHVDAQLVNNTIALEDRQGLAEGQAPRADALRFHWGRNASQAPAAWIAPVETKKTERGEPTDWYWFTGGGALVATPAGQPQAVAFLFHIARQASKPGVWGFESCGSTLATIDDLAKPVDEWVVRQHRIPFAIDAAAHRADPTLEETAWGVAAWRETPREPGQPARLYIYGTRGGDPRKLLLARAPASSVTDFAAWRFYAGDGRWSDRPADATAIVAGVPAELSVESVAFAGRRRFLMVHSEPLLGRRILVRTAEQPEGPWSAPVAVYSAPEPERNLHYFAYAAKGHLSLSLPGTLLISYVVNSHDFNAMVGDASIYRPRFVQVPLSVVLPALEPSP